MLVSLAVLLPFLPLPHRPTLHEQRVEDLAVRARPTIVVITGTGRDGKRSGLGSGFFIRPDGLIATNAHVIGEGRPLRVELNDGSTHDVTEIVATDRKRDLALIRIAGKQLPYLPLRLGTRPKDGESIVVLGNPRGLKFSVVAGVVSGVRQIDGQEMLQVATPIEPGNSGGPVLDRFGRVVGIVTLKSAVTENLGFAVPIAALQPLRDKPNPVPYAQWLTLGALDPEEWRPVLGGQWRQRAGRVLVEGLGTGFGGRALCVRVPAPPALPFEVSVAVKMQDESGAAGLAFHIDDEQRHYGFYPTNGGMRLTRFDGPDVLSWNILRQITTPHYRPGEWNVLRVRVEKTGLQCFVNGKLVIESDDTERTQGKIGLVKFRDTNAEFKNFRVGRDLAEPKADPQALAKLLTEMDWEQPLRRSLVEKFAAKEKATPQALRDQARKLEQQAEQMRKLAGRLHASRTLGELSKLLAQPEQQIDLARAALLLAKLDNEEVDIEAYLTELDRWAKRIREKLPAEATDTEKLTALGTFLFRERGFHGNRDDYHHRSNSYLNEVIDDREGLPITLSVLYMESARRLGVTVVGLGLPGHFVVRYDPPNGPGLVIDPFERGEVLSDADVRKRIEDAVGEYRAEFLKPLPKRLILVRMLRNLLRAAQADQDVEAVLRYANAAVTIAPEETGAERFLRAVLIYRDGGKEEARADVQWLLEHEPEGVDLRRVREFQRALAREE